VLVLLRPLCPASRARPARARRWQKVNGIAETKVQLHGPVRARVAIMSIRLSAIQSSFANYNVAGIFSLFSLDAVERIMLHTCSPLCSRTLSSRRTNGWASEELPTLGVSTKFGPCVVHHPQSGTAPEDPLGDPIFFPTRTLQAPESGEREEARKQTPSIEKVDNQ
jgi:hypothetical protein